MVCETHIYTRLTRAQTADLRKHLDQTLALLRQPLRGDESDDRPIAEINKINRVICGSEISNQDQLEILYDVLDWLYYDYERCSTRTKVDDIEEERKMQPYQRALIMLGRHVMRERRASQGVPPDLKAWFDS